MVPAMVTQEALKTSRTAIDRLCEGMLPRRPPPAARRNHRSSLRTLPSHLGTSKSKSRLESASKVGCFGLGRLGFCLSRARDSRSFVMIRLRRQTSGAINVVWRVDGFLAIQQTGCTQTSALRNGPISGQLTTRYVTVPERVLHDVNHTTDSQLYFMSSPNDYSAGMRVLPRPNAPLSGELWNA